MKYIGYYIGTVLSISIGYFILELGLLKSIGFGIIGLIISIFIIDPILERTIFKKKYTSPADNGVWAHSIQELESNTSEKGEKE